MKYVFAFTCSLLILICCCCTQSSSRILMGNWKQIKGQGNGSLVQICNEKEMGQETIVGKYKGKCIWTGFKDLGNTEGQFLVYRRYRCLEGPRKRLSGIKLKPCLLVVKENQLKLLSLDAEEVLEVYQRVEGEM